MFRKNAGHRQIGMFDNVEQLPERVRRRLMASWAGTFYREVFCRIDEERFAGLYSAEPSRPNTPVNVLIGLEILKSGFGWSDEELYDHFLFDVQVRYAVGQRDLTSGDFELRTMYHFRQRLAGHMQETGENLLDEVFKQVTDEQLAVLKLKTGHQRMDSTQIASNIRQASRLHLLVEVVQRVGRMLSEEERAKYGAELASYCEGTAGQFCYRVKGAAIDEHLAALGRLMYRLVVELGVGYRERAVYQMLCRVFAEHFAVEGVEADTVVRVKRGRELSATALQSPDDWEATYREKGGVGYRGYVANVSETCAPENPVQLITLVQVAPNATDDEQMLVEAVPELKVRTQVEVLETDGGFTGPEAEEVLREQAVVQVPSGIRGGRPSADRLGWAEYTWELDGEGLPTKVTCPGGQTAEVRPARQKKRYQADFALSHCELCPLLNRCPARPLKRQPLRRLDLTARNAQVGQLRQRCARSREAGHNWRAAIESTIRSLKHPFGGQVGKLPVRGHIRVAMVITAGALMVNLRRIWRYQQGSSHSKAPAGASPVSSCWSRLRYVTNLVHRRQAHLFPSLALTLAKT